MPSADSLVSRRAGRLFLLLLAPILAVLLLPSPANAHAFLVSTSPQQGERLVTPIAMVELRFTEPVAPGSVRVEVRSGGERLVDVGPLRRAPDGLSVELPLPRLAEGVYVVAWRAVSAVDGHEEAGEFAFAMGEAERVPAARRTGRVAWPQAASGWVALAGLLVAFGGLVSERWIWGPLAERMGARALRLPVGALVVLGMVGGVAQVALSLSASGAGVPRGLAALADRPALLALVQLTLAGYGLALLALPRLRRWALGPLAAALTVAALRGHAGSGPGSWWSAPANAIHIVAVGVWLGALVHLLVVLWRSRGAEVREAVADGVRRYAALALVAVAIAVGAGALTAFSQFQRPGQLLSSTYGLILIGKLGLVGGALGLATVARSRGVRGKSGVRSSLVSRLVRPEAALVLLAVGAASTLAATPPPRAEATEGLLGPPPLRGRAGRFADLAGSLAVHLAAAPGRLQVRVIAPSRSPAPSEIAIEGRTASGRSFRLSPRPCGVGCATSAFRWESGATAVHVRVRSEVWESGTVRFEVPSPVLSADPSLLRRTVEAMRAEPRVAFTEVVSSGTRSRARNRVVLSGSKLMDLEVYAAGAVTDVRPVPALHGARAFTAFLPGSWIWMRLETDEQGRLVYETIVSPGHRIVRRFTYGGRG
ncbi:MAG: copper resistance protein CopC [Actinomycetota bacterium]